MIQIYDMVMEKFPFNVSSSLIQAHITVVSHQIEGFGERTVHHPSTFSHPSIDDWNNIHSRVVLSSSVVS